ncbi:MAG: transporter substrate-binding domain-containing protein [Desulfobacterales bacterium]|jgi:polar amino acid transport system substrate-binding protein
MISRRNFFGKTIGIGAAAVGLLGFKSKSAQAATDKRDSLLYKVLDRGKIIVGTGSGNPPWHFEDEKGELQGFDVTMARLLAKGLFDDPKAVEFNRQKPDARIPNLQANKVDVVFQFMTVNAQRAQLAEFSIPYYREGVNTLLMKNSPYKGAGDLAAAGKQVTVSVLQNVFAEDLVHDGIPNAKVLQLDTQANVMLALDSGRVEAAAIDDSTVRWMVAQEPDKYKVGDTGWWPQTYAGAVRPGDAIWLNYVNTILHEAMTGVEFAEYSAAFKKYFGEQLPNPQTGFPMEYK